MRTYLFSLVLVFVFAGCDSSSPTEIEGGAQTFTGALAAEGTATHTFVVTRQGGILIEVLNVDFDPPREDQSRLALALGFGRTDSEGECLLTFQTAIITGTRSAFAVDPVEYCFQVSDTGSLAEEETGLYTFTVSPSG